MTDEDWKYPQQPYRKNGWLQVDDNPPLKSPHKIYYEEYGNPDGEPVMFLHGGPGGTCTPNFSRFFDPERYRIILFDQRGCGKSVPNVAKDGAQAGLANNETSYLVDDIAKLRNHLEIKSKMHVFGGSWGSILAQAYAIKYPETVQTLILRGIWQATKQDLDYMYQGNAETYHKGPYNVTVPGSYLFYPEEWKEYVEIIPQNRRKDMIKAYKEIFDMVPRTPEQQETKRKALVAWSKWEEVISNIVPNTKNVGKYGSDEFATSFAQIENHYFTNNMFMENHYLIKNVERIKDIPIHIVHGRFDQVCPMYQADILVDALRNVGTEPASYVRTTAGHSALELENAMVLTNIMDNLPKMDHSKLPGTKVTGADATQSY
ncbi:prolyl aminopeptidase [Ktedonobacter robiniae]|uniref:Proline iminopeptidase n=1 Tax=Ktedonobacter robiniae TaxID=2778365 RepID=A0ABQ3UVI2_9CHLR|nr:prolyl aminopeptidase [Ktedonobacter robiniae]GHO56688.1 proline iminopeptidase [Ktedonobacter robiniae]